MCILLNVKKHEKTFALNVDIFRNHQQRRLMLQNIPTSDIVINN